MKRTPAVFSLAALALAAAAGAQSGILFVGQEGGDQVIKTAELSGFPGLSYADGSEFFVQGAAGTPEGFIYICDGYFSNDLYILVPGGAPSRIARLSASGVYGLGYVNGKLYGYANFATPKGIYEINTSSGECTLRMSTEAEGLLFFALDGNAADGQLYGFSEYGLTGLYSIDPSNWTMHRVAPTPPGSYGMCRGMAVGNNTAYMVDTHPTDSYYAYDLSQGDNGTYVPFANPYPESRNGGGAWYIPGPPPPPPANDACADATPIGEGTFAFSTLTATTDGTSSCGIGGYNDVWFRYAPTFAHYAILKTCDNAGYDTMISVYPGSCGGQELVCNDDNCGVQSSVGLSVLPGETYLVRVSGWSDTDRGVGNLVITDCFQPSFTTQPESLRTCANSSPDFAVVIRSAATATGDISYQWYRNGVQLTSGPTGTGSQIFGVTGPNLVIISPGTADGASYTCVATATCQSEVSVTSDPAVLTVCAQDFNCDGDINPDDLGDFITCYFSEPPCARADFNGDSNVNPDDLGDFITVYFGPAC